MLISLLTSSPLLGINLTNLNGTHGMTSDNLPESTILVHSSFITWEGGSAGADISPPGSLRSIERWRVLDSDTPSSLDTSIPDLTANSFTTCPRFFPGMLCCHAKFCQLIRGGAGGCYCKSFNTSSLFHVTLMKLGECVFGLARFEDGVSNDCNFLFCQ